MKTLSSAITTALFVSAAAFAQQSPVVVVDQGTRIMEVNMCSKAFNEVKNENPRDAAADRAYSIVERRLVDLEAIPKDKREDELYKFEMQSCLTSVEILKTQLEKAKLRKKLDSLSKIIITAQSELIASLSSDASQASSLASRLQRDSEDLSAKLATTQNQLDLERKKAEARQEEARKKLDNLQSKYINVHKDARGIILSMQDILFETAKANLTPDLEKNLMKVAGILIGYQEADVIIEGHTDNVGKPVSNKQLSQKRADTVKKFLVKEGVKATRLKTMGFGDTKPVADNSTDEGKAKNRRVDLVIKDKNL